MSSDNSLEALALALTSSDEDKRYEALEALGQYSKEQAMPLLLQALSNEDEYIRRKAIRLLERYSDVQVVEPVMAMLNDESFLVRYDAIEALRKLADARAIDVLLIQLADEYGRTRSLASAALSVFPITEVLQNFTRMIAEPTVTHARIAVALMAGPWGSEHLFPLVIAALADRDWRVRWRAIEVLAKRSDERALEPLLHVLRDEHEQVRKRVVQALAEFEQQEVLQAFTERLVEEKSAKVRIALVIAIERWGKKAAPQLLTLLSDENEPEVQHKAIQVLGDIGDTRATEPLLALLKDETTRVLAIQALGKIGDERAIDPLLELLFAKEATGELHVFLCASLASFQYLQVVKAFTHIVEDPALRHMRSAAVLALGQWRHEQAVPLLLVALKDEDWQVRWAAAQSLAQQPDPRAVEPLLATLEDEKLQVRCRAIEALGKSGDERVIASLLRQFANRERQIRIAAATALGAFHVEEVMSVFLDALEHDPAKEVRAQVIAAFGEWRDERAANALFAELKKPVQEHDDHLPVVYALALHYNDTWLLAALHTIQRHEGDSDEYITLPGGKFIEWDDAVKLVIEYALSMGK